MKPHVWACVEPLTRRGKYLYKKKKTLPSVIYPSEWKTAGFQSDGGGTFIFHPLLLKALIARYSFHVSRYKVVDANSSVPVLKSFVGWRWVLFVYFQSVTEILFVVKACAMLPVNQQGEVLLLYFSLFFFSVTFDKTATSHCWSPFMKSFSLCEWQCEMKTVNAYMFYWLCSCLKWLIKTKVKIQKAYE